MNDTGLKSLLRPEAEPIDCQRDKHRLLDIIIHFIPFIVNSLIVNTRLVMKTRVSPHRSLIYSQIKYVYSEYPVIVSKLCSL